MYIYISVFVLLSYINHKSYDIFDKILSNNFNVYNNLTNNRKLYVLKNTIKSILLCITSIYATYVFIDPILYNKWDNFTIHMLGLLYSITDIISLYKVPKLPKSTKLHHICVTILCITNLFNDYTYFTFWRALLAYAILSAYSFTVNLYLAYRIISPNDYWRVVLCKIAYYTYMICFTFNWILQYYTAYVMWGIYNKTNNFNVIFLLYFIVAHLIMYDDIILIKFLFNSVKDNKLNLD